jgi:bacterioferritin-associated ferredoxin
VIVCICRGICERRLEALVAAGARTVEQVEQLCGAGGDCGACLSEVERIVDRGAVCVRRTSGSAPIALGAVRTP